METLTTREQLTRQFVRTHGEAGRCAQMMRAELDKPHDQRDQGLILVLTEALQEYAKALDAFTRALNAMDTYRPPDPTVDPITFAHPSGVFAQPIDREQVRLQAEQQLQQQQQAAELSRQARGDGTALAADVALPAVPVSR